jgi:hypothetical protein
LAFAIKVARRRAALEYFRDADIEPDARISDAVHLIKSRRQADGRWLLERAYDEPLPVPRGVKFPSASPQGA